MHSTKTQKEGWLMPKHPLHLVMAIYKSKINLGPKKQNSQGIALEHKH